MWFRLPSSVLAFAVLSMACSGETGADRDELGEEGEAIIAGQMTTGHPSAVFLSMECTGTLISPRVVLTAKHCTEGSNAASIQAYVTNTAYEGSPIQVTKIAQHAQTDISLLALAQPAGVMPTPVFGGVQGSLEEHVGESVTYVGFGASNNNQPPNDGFGPKQVGSSPLDHLDGDALLTGYDMNASWHCFGDSGGSALMNIHGVEQLVGVISSGAADQCGVPGDLSIRTDSYYGWIMGFTVQEDGPPACNHDGRCQDECANEDPDCSGAVTTAPVPSCGADGTCDATCEADPDCGGTPPEPTNQCVRDGVCVGTCGVADPDCPSGKSKPPTVLTLDDDSEPSATCAVRSRARSNEWGYLGGLTLVAFLLRGRRQNVYRLRRCGRLRGSG
jgi:hypothetical protein